MFEWREKFSENSWNSDEFCAADAQKKCSVLGDIDGE